MKSCVIFGPNTQLRGSEDYKKLNLFMLSTITKFFVILDTDENHDHDLNLGIVQILCRVHFPGNHTFVQSCLDEGTG